MKEFANNQRAEFMTVEEVVELLQLRPSWVYAHADDLGVSRLGKYLRFHRPRILEILIGDQKAPAGSKPIDPKS